MSHTLTKPAAKPRRPGTASRPAHGARPSRTAAGIVRSFVEGSAHGFTGASSSGLIDQINAGLPIHELEDLQESLGLSIEQLAPRLGISKATLHRRKLQGRLDPAESDRVVRLARLMGRALEALESVENARRWLTSAQFGLGDAVPLDYAGTEVGAREVEDLLGRIEHGVYS